MSRPGTDRRTAVRSRSLPLLDAAADAAVQAPSVHNTQPWRIRLHPDRLELHADRTRRLPVLDPTGRALVQSLGAALLNARVAVAAAGRAARVERLPDPADPDLVAVLRPVDGPPDTALAALAPAVRARRTNRRRYGPDRLPEEALQALVAAAAAEDTVLVPVTREEHVRLLARLTREADRIQRGDAAHREELRRWTTRPPGGGDGVPAVAVPRSAGRRAGHPRDDVPPVRDLDPAGVGRLPAQTDPGTGQVLALLATSRDDPLAWLRCGEALERVLLELTARGWAAGPQTQAVEVPVVRSQLRSALSWDAHPQSVLRIGRAAATSPTPRRPRAAVVEGSPAPAPRPSRVPTAPARRHRPVPDGRGGTTWV